MDVASTLTWVVGGAIFLIFFYSQINPRGFKNLRRKFFGKEKKHGEVWEYQTYKPIPGLPYILDILVQTPDYTGEYTNCYINDSGTNTIVLDGDIHIHGVDGNPNLIENENLNVDNAFSLMAGNGKVFCNIDTSGRTHKNWRGFDKDGRSYYASKIRSLEMENADLKNDIQNYKQIFEEKKMADADFIGTMTRQRKKGTDAEETEEEG